MKPRIALTGATGFLGTHVLLQLLQQGYSVNACVRSINSSKTKELVDNILPSSSTDHQHQLKFFETDLLGKNSSLSYQNAFSGCDYVIHTAAVALALARVENPEKQIIEPSISGMESVLDACSKTPPLKRMVFTCSQVALWDVRKPDQSPENPLIYTEKDFNTFVTTQPNCGGDYYGYAKTVAEKMALENNKSVDTISLLPSAILGKVFNKSHSKASPVWIRNILQCNKQLDFRCGWVNVEDVAKAHIEACFFSSPVSSDEKQKQNRFIINSKDLFLSELAPMIQKMFPQYRAEFHNLDQEELEKLAKESEYHRLFAEQKSFIQDNTLSRQVLKIDYKSVEESVKETVESLVKGGFVKPVMK